MNTSAGKILKAETVKIQGPYQLELNAPSGTVQASAKPQKVTSQVNIVEKNDAYAVLEITCGCGAKTYVQCNYDNQA